MYLFNIINGNKFIKEPFHGELFAEMDNIIQGTDTRVCINIFPRSGKSTLATYLCIYSFLKNPKSQIIYTSYNQDLLRQISHNMAQIIQNPLFQALYPWFGMPSVESVEDKPIDEYWLHKALEIEKKPTFSAKRITTPAGGVILFASLGSSILGFGAGVRGAKGFSGLVVLDDPDNPSTIRSELIREKTKTYFSDTLLSRLNNPDVPIINIQQRVHIDDLSAHLYNNYGFKPFVFPLIDDNEVCICPSQYTPARIEELKVNNYVFQAQYQQKPLILGGGVIKHEWWRYYQDPQDTRYLRLFITADTANKTKEWNDYTAIGVWGLTAQRKLRLLDMVHAKLEIPELQATFLALYDKWRDGIGPAKLTKIIIEDKASGTQVIQQLSRGYGLPIVPYMPEKDKLTRALDAVPQIVAGNVELPESENHPISRELLAETDAFSADGTAPHDDLTDMTTAAINEAFNQRGYF